MPPTLDLDFITRQPQPSIGVALEPAHNVLNSMVLLNAVEKLSGLGEWVYRTAARLSAAEMHRNRLVFEGLYHAVQPVRSWPSFSAYLDDLAASDGAVLRDRLLWQISAHSHRAADLAGAEPATSIAPAALLESVDTYLGFLRQHFESIDEAIEIETHALLNDPPAMKALALAHISALWKAHAAQEWERVKPMLQESVGAFQRIDISRLSAAEAMRAITGQEPNEKWERLLASARQIVFVPSAHLGPYLHKFAEGNQLWLLFGARLPEGIQAGPSALSRSDLLVRLGALTDDTRLRILALLSQHDELCAQDIMTQLDLTQSAASRHLRQLSATGYITERRREIAKCYTLNRERIQDTFQALDRFLVQP
ncbi:MAG: winged helix-turn-helix transcriptional regulator [Kouleothrix sp.]|nr:winged helix-turn-helix transcriptional regulator [Kouleothrix sp.]